MRFYQYVIRWLNYLFNSFISEEGLQAKAFMESGQLVPDNVMVQLILNELQKLKHESWLLDGINMVYTNLVAIKMHLPVLLIFRKPQLSHFI